MMNMFKHSFWVGASGVLLLCMASSARAQDVEEEIFCYDIVDYYWNEVGLIAPELEHTACEDAPEGYGWAEIVDGYGLPLVPRELALISSQDSFLVKNGKLTSILLYDQNMSLSFIELPNTEHDTPLGPLSPYLAPPWLAPQNALETSSFGGFDPEGSSGGTFGEPVYSVHHNPLPSPPVLPPTIIWVSGGWGDGPLCPTCVDGSGGGGSGGGGGGGGGGTGGSGSGGSGGSSAAEIKYVIAPHKKLIDLDAHLNCFELDYGQLVLRSAQYTHEVVIHLDAPYAFGRGPSVGRPDQFGDAWIEISQTYTDSSGRATTVKKVIGFSPDTVVKNDNRIAPLRFSNQSDRFADVSFSTGVIDHNQFISVINALKVLASHNYDLKNYNSTNMVFDLFLSSGVGTAMYPYDQVQRMATPQALAEHIAQHVPSAANIPGIRWHRSTAESSGGVVSVPESPCGSASTRD